MSKRALYNVDTLRILATFLLVSFHVIGADVQHGMHQDYPSLWRFFADGFIDIRMPLFAFIAGAVYASKPLSLDNASGFFKGKFRRLVVPGIAASLVAWIASNLILQGGFAYGANLISVFTLSMGHFWFLQAILVIFVVIGAVDAALRYRAELPMFCVALLILFVWNRMPPPYVPYLQVEATGYLTPYFLLGLVVYRNYERIVVWRTAIAVASICLVVLGVVLEEATYQSSGHLSSNRFDLQNIALGLGAIVLAVLYFPRIPLLDRLSLYAFTIYLYHPIGTSAVRHVMESVGWGGTTLHFILGFVLSILMCCVLHLIASRFEWPRLVLLGLRTPAGRTVL